MLEFENVTVSLAGVRVLRNVSFKIDASETVALIGANGAGKTTALRTIMGFTDVSGEIRFGEMALTAVAPAKRPRLGIGYAPEDRRLFSAFTVEDNILMPGQVAKLTPGELRRRLDLIYEILPELRELAARPAGSVSGGQGKMVALGRALMIGRKLIMLDEPFQGLAPALARRYAEALRRLRDTDSEVTLIITESNPGLLKNFADRALVIDRGEVRAGSLNAEEAA
ncbi:ATP-binding cassette domain-containing protein [Pelagibius litoralis]|uniref:ATP-binding cassette domain-containing protein n=1 Tax=Pelagibius litoralis TaxID=374515 RepID=A0A967F053_9PROT|nr:ATP-binding cassette domain-containing protein [Pelagibius litoralis]NIA70581.1 ATP-binding cassette domain-containing protein [Pelagibius litoralis]